MAKVACRACDGQTERRSEDRDNVFRATVTKCARCNGSGVEPSPTKGKRRFFGSRQELDEDEQNLDRAADRFLRRHGFGRNGR